MADEHRHALRSYAAEAALARDLLRLRAERLAVLPGHFADPEWDMLLDLFAAQALGRRTAVSSLIVAAGVPQTTALRRVHRLVHAGVLAEHADPRDGRRTYLTMSAACFERLADLLRRWRGELARLADRHGSPPDRA